MKALHSYLANSLKVLLVSPPGMGKTARIIAAATANGYKTIVMRASLSERIDFGGALIADHEAGITRALPLEQLAYLKTTDDKVLLFLDDLGQAPIDVQAALMKLFDKGELGPNVLIWGATNRPADKAGVSALCEPLRSRFDLAFSIPTPDYSDRADGPTVLGTYQEEVNNWCEWVLDTYPEAYETVAWHRSPQLGADNPVGPVLYGWKPSADPALRMPDFRSWETVCKLLKAGIRDMHSLGAAIGKGQAVAFLNFCEVVGQLPDPQQVWMDPEGAPVPVDTGALCLTAVRLGSAVQPQYAGAFIKYVTRLPQMFGALSVRDAYRRLGSGLAANKEWQTWFVANQSLFV